MQASGGLRRRYKLAWFESGLRYLGMIQRSRERSGDGHLE